MVGDPHRGGGEEPEPHGGATSEHETQRVQSGDHRGVLQDVVAVNDRRQPRCVGGGRPRSRRKQMAARQRLGLQPVEGLVIVDRQIRKQVTIDHDCRDRAEQSRDHHGPPRHRHRDQTRPQNHQWLSPCRSWDERCAGRRIEAAIRLVRAGQTPPTTRSPGSRTVAKAREPVGAPTRHLNGGRHIGAPRTGHGPTLPTGRTRAGPPPTSWPFRQRWTPEPAATRRPPATVTSHRRRTLSRDDRRRAVGVQRRWHPAGH